MISIIVPAYNAARTLPACLQALQAQTLAKNTFEIIVVDDGSSDETAQIAREAGVRLICQKNGGAAAARNRGAQEAIGDILLFTDADCKPVADWAAHLIQPFSDPEVVGAKGTYLTTQSELTARFVQLEYQDKYDRMRQLDHIDFVDTYSAAYHRDIFLAMGGFDTSFPGASVEDQEFSFRLAEAGHRLVFVPEAKVYHIHDRFVSEYFKRKYAIGYWKPLVIQRHPEKLIQDSHTPQVLKMQMGMAALGAGFFAVGAVMGRRIWHYLGFFSWLALLMSGLSFYQKIWRLDRPVMAVAPWLLFVRAWALGLGYISGYARLMLAKQAKIDVR